MANFSENYGLDFLMEKDNLTGFIGYLIKEGKPIAGYYGCPYLFKPLGDVEYWVRTEKNSEGKLEVAGIDSHCGGRCVWDLIYSGLDITPKNFSKLKRVLMLSRADGTKGMLPVELITADVLPGYMEGDVITVQVVGLPLEINYYADQDEYEADQPEGKDGHKWLIDDGSLLPFSFLVNHQVGRYEEGKEYESDSHVHFKATVTKLYKGIFAPEEEENFTFIRCRVETKFGPIEFDHAIDQVKEEQWKNIKVGSVVSGVCIISGDVAIHEYENGAIKDFQHDLMLLRYTFAGGDPERLRSVLAEDAVYSTETSGKEFLGPDRIIEKIKYVQDNKKEKYYAWLATIDAVDEEAEYPVGTRCIVLAPGEEENFESIAFIRVNQDGLIENIKVSTDSRYSLKLD